MRVLVVIVLVVVAMSLIGWLSFTSTDGSATVEFNTDKASADTEKVIESARDLTRDAIHEVDEAAHKIDDDHVDTPQEVLK